MSFIGNSVDITNYRIGLFIVEGIAGRNPSGELRWNVSCTLCGHLQILPHSILVRLIEARKTQLNLQCGNGACPASRTAHQSETLADVHRRERREEQAAAQAQIEAQRAADAAAVRQQRADAEKLAFQRQYITFWNHQFLAGTPNIISRERWKQIPADTRSRILERIAADPTLQVSE